MRRTIIRRIFQLIIILMGISFLSFFLLHISPSDPAFIKLSEMGTPPTEALLQETREEMGLNEPMLSQYFRWLKRAVRFDFGISYKTGRPVLTEFHHCLANTLKLTLAGFLVALFISFPLGILSAVKQNKFSDFLIRLLSIFSLSIPDFYLALIFLFVFGLRLKIFPIMGDDGFQHLVMPALVLGIVSAGKLIRQIRVAVLSELEKDYVKGVRSLGLPEWQVLWRNVLKNAMLPILTVMGLTFGHLLGGTSAIEVLFNYRGVSSQAVTSIYYRDLPMIQMYTLWMATIFTTLNFLVDLSYTLMDPKLKLK